MTRGWLAVISAEHVARAVELGIAQVNHGKRAPLTRMSAGDTLVYYSPTVIRGVADGYRSFTAIGTFPDDEIRQADEGDFQPFRRSIDYEPSRHVAVEKLKPELRFTDSPNWGYQLRLGLIELDLADVATIRAAMTTASGTS